MRKYSNRSSPLSIERDIESLETILDYLRPLRNNNPTGEVQVIKI